MSSPNEPGDTRGADPLSGSAPHPPEGGARAAQPTKPVAPDPASDQSAGAPPWQRAAGRPDRPRADHLARPDGVAPPRHLAEPPAPSASEVTRTIEPVPATAPPGRPEANPGDPAATAAVLDARASRYLSGTAAPAAFQQPKPPAVDARPPAVRPEAPRAAEIASELPDLSGGSAGPVARGANAEAPTERTSRIEVAPQTKGGPVRASMQIRRIDPWSTLKVSLLLSVAMFFVWMIAVAFLYLVLGGMGVWSKLNSNVGDLLTSGGGGEVLSAGTVFGGAFLIGLLNIVLLTAVATLGAFIYNLATDIVGGIEVTLADRD